MAHTFVEQARYARIIAVQAKEARKSGSEPKTVSLAKFKTDGRFQPVELLMDRYDEIENIFAEA